MEKQFPSTSTLIQGSNLFQTFFVQFISNIEICFCILHSHSNSSVNDCLFDRSSIATLLSSLYIYFTLIYSVRFSSIPWHSDDCLENSLWLIFPTQNFKIFSHFRFVSDLEIRQKWIFWRRRCSKLRLAKMRSISRILAVTYLFCFRLAYNTSKF